MNSFQSFLNTKVNIDQRALLDQTFQSALKKFDKNKKSRSSSKYQPQSYALNDITNTNTNRITSKPYSSTRLTSISNQNFNSNFNLTPSTNLKSDFNTPSLSTNSNYFLKSNRNAPSDSDNDDENFYNQSSSEFHFEPYEKEINFTEKFNNKAKNDDYKFQLNPNRTFNKEENIYSKQLNLQQQQFKTDLLEQIQPPLPVQSSSTDSIQIQAPILNQVDQIQTQPLALSNTKQESTDRNKEEEIKQFREHLKKRILMKKGKESEENMSNSNINQSKKYSELKKIDLQPSSIQYRKTAIISIDTNPVVSLNSTSNATNNAKIEAKPFESSRKNSKLSQSSNELQERQISQFDFGQNEVLSSVKYSKNLNLNEDKSFSTDYNIRQSQINDTVGKISIDNFDNYSPDTKYFLDDMNKDNSNLNNNEPSANNFNIIKSNLISDDNGPKNNQLSNEDEKRTIKDYNSKNEKIALNDNCRNINDKVNVIIKNNDPSIATFNYSRSEININKDENIQPSKIANSRSDNIQFGRLTKENPASLEQNDTINSSHSLNELKSQARAQFTKDREYLIQMQDDIIKEREIVNARLLDSRPTDLINAFKQRMMNFTSRTIGSQQASTTPNNEEVQVGTSNVCQDTINMNKSNSFLVENDELSSFDEDLNIQSQNQAEFNYSFNENDFNFANGNDSDENADSSFDSSCFVQLKEFADANAKDFEKLEADFKKEFTDDPNENNDK